MAIKPRFIMLSILIVICALTLGGLAIRWYPSHIPFLNRMLPAAIGTANSEASGSSYKGLKPMPDDPNGVYYEDRVLVLMYHDVGPNPNDSKTLSLAHFEEQLRLMRNNNFHWITMEQYRDFILRAAPVPANAVLLTFDDGYESLYRYAYPLLQKYHAPASSFLIVNTIDNPHNGGFPRVSWDQVREMHNNGMSFYSHTFDSHKYVPTGASNSKPMSMIARRIYLKDKERKETELEYEQRAALDLKQANDILYRQLGVQNHVLAFPYGAFSESLLTVAHGLGIDVTLTVKSGLNRTGQTNGFRLNAGGMDNDPVLQLSLMKQAERLLGDSRFDDARPRQLTFLSLFAILAIIGILWLRTAWKLKQLIRSVTP